MPEKHYYHKFFKKINPKTLEIVRKYVRKKGLQKVKKDKGFKLLREMSNELTDLYDIPVVYTIEETKYLVGEEEATYYSKVEEAIGLAEPNLLSFLHEFRHHMQKFDLQCYDDKEMDARGWSVSTFYLALPDLFEEAWKNGRIWYMKPYNPEKL